MLLANEILETINMVDMQNLDVRTVTLGISLLDCIDPSAEKTAKNIYNKIVAKGKDLVRIADDVAAKYNVPIVNKRVSVTPIAIIGNATDATDYTIFAKALDEIQKVKYGLENNLSSDLMALDIKEALYQFGMITGQVTNDELLGNIFANFCIGK